ncbi:Uncharacterised protein [Mycobacterium tuberculosis]|nr:Uncharacterised protein [Mycobacterium tuberculosis]
MVFFSLEMFVSTPQRLKYRSPNISFSNPSSCHRLVAITSVVDCSSTLTKRMRILVELSVANPLWRRPLMEAWVGASSMTWETFPVFRNLLTNSSESFALITNLRSLSCQLWSANILNVE